MVDELINKLQISRYGRITSIQFLLYTIFYPNSMQHYILLDTLISNDITKSIAIISILQFFGEFFNSKNSKVDVGYEFSKSIAIP